MKQKKSFQRKKSISLFTVKEMKEMYFYYCKWTFGTPLIYRMSAAVSCRCAVSWGCAKFKLLCVWRGV